MGTKQTKGFWPKNGFDLVRKEDIYGVVVGMEGVILDDSEYLHKTTGINKKRSFFVEESSASKANGIVQNYVNSPQKYRLIDCQCTTFALEVLNAAGEHVDAGVPPRPSVLIRNIN